MNYNDIINSKFTNQQNKEYTVLSYQGKTDNKHYYEINFIETGNKYLEERSRVRNGKCKDTTELKLKKSVKKAADLKQKNRLTKKSEAEYKSFDFIDKTVLALDQASNTGWCVIRNNKIVKFGCIPKKYDNFYINAVNTMVELSKIRSEYTPDILFFEDIYLGLNVNVMEKLAGLKGMITYFCEVNKLEYECIKSNSWKAYHNITGERNKQKNESVEKVRETIKQDVTDDVADAILLGIFAVKNLAHKTV